MIGVFAPGDQPIKPWRFRLYMAALLGLAVMSLLPADFGRDRAARPAPQETMRGARFEVVRFGQPTEEIRDLLRQIGLPWFLRRQGAIGRFEEGAGEYRIELVYRGGSVGYFIERLAAIDADRSKMFVAFVLTDKALLDELTAPIGAQRDPVALMSLIMAEHIRSSVTGDSFDVSIVDAQSGGLFDALRKRMGRIAPCPAPEIDNFPLCERDREAANIRRAYREEAERAGAAASRL